MSDTFNMTAGDWSNDGHGQTETQLVHTDLTYADVETAFAALNTMLKSKYKFTMKDVCCNYEDNKLTDEQRDAFIEMGIDLTQLCEIYDEDDENEDDIVYALDSTGFVDLAIALLNFQNPLLNVRQGKASKRKQLNIGGYGLFWL